MAQITAALVKQLREMTDSPMMECKKALVEADGDIEKAVDVLRTMGLAKAVKKAGRATNEGAVLDYVSEDGTFGALAEVKCETDFVSGTDKFKALVTKVAKAVAENGPTDDESLKAAATDGETVEAIITEMIHVIGENMKVARFQRVAVESGALAAYVHHNGKLADIVTFDFANEGTKDNADFTGFAHDVAMQVAAAAPVAAKREDVPADVIEHEKSIYMAQAAESGKPEAIQERMATGKLEKFFKENVLTEQESIKESGSTINELAAKVSKAAGDDVKVVSFVRYSFGE